jgi:hypothetical protein
MVRRLQGPHTTAKLPVLRYTTTRAALERASAPGRQLRQNRKTLMNTGTQSIAVRSQIHSYSELVQRIHYDLRIQHPEWVEPNGESPICDDYEARLMEQLEALVRQNANEPDYAPSVD